MTYTCKGCSKVISVDALVDQRFSVAVCSDIGHAGPFEVVLPGRTETRPAIVTARNAVVE